MNVELQPLAMVDGRKLDYISISEDGTKKNHIPMGMDSSHFIDGHDPKTMVSFDHDTSKVLRYIPLVNKQKAIENGHRNSGFTHSKW